MDYLTYAYLQQGQESDAARVIAALHAIGTMAGSDFKVGYAATAMPVRFAIERRRWRDAAELQPLPQSAPEVAAIVYWARAVANARAGNPQDSNSDIAGIEACLQQLQASGKQYWAAQVDVLNKEAKAWQLAASAHPVESLALLRASAEKEDTVEKLPVTPGPIVPAREQLGELLLQLNQPQQALREFQAALRAAPGRRGALNGAAKAADLAGDIRTASQMRARLKN